MSNSATLTPSNNGVRRRPHLSIRPPQKWSPLALGEMWRYRDLFLTLATRDVKLRYRQTALGVTWVVLQPLLAAAIFSFVFGRVARMPSGGVPYLVFAYAGLLGWTTFNSTLTKASACVVQNSQLVSKVFFPRLILPLSTVFSTLIDFAVASGVMALLLAYHHIAPGWGILLLPVWVLMMIVLAVGLGLYTSALMVTYRDLQYAIPVLTQLLLYASPVAYAASAVPASLRRYYFLNPLAGLLEAFRWSLLGRSQLHWANLSYSAVVACLAFVWGAFSFKRMEQRFADVI